MKNKSCGDRLAETSSSQSGKAFLEAAMLFAHCILSNVRCIAYHGGYKKPLLSDVERALSEGRMRGLGV